MSLANNNGLTFDTINQTIAAVASKSEASLRQAISAMPENPSSGDLLQMQVRVQQWTMLTQIQSTVVKELADAMKGVIQKSA